MKHEQEKREMEEKHRREMMAMQSKLDTAPVPVQGQSPEHPSTTADVVSHSLPDPHSLNFLEESNQPHPDPDVLHTHRPLPSDLDTKALSFLDAFGKETTNRSTGQSLPIGLMPRHPPAAQPPVSQSQTFLYTSNHSGSSSQNSRP